MDYYVHEDDVKPTASTALDNWGATLHSLANVAPEIAEAVNEIGERLGAVYALAEQSKNNEAMEQISCSWHRVQEMATKAVILDGGIQAAKEVIKVIDEERQRLDAAYAELERAVDEVDTQDERVEALVNHVLSEGECDYIEGVFDEMHYFIKRYTKISDFLTISLFLDALRGDYLMDERQISLLTELVSSFGIVKAGER